jgi:hypothetical protein
MRSDRIVAGNVAMCEGVRDRDALMEFRRADDELTFKDLLAYKTSVDLSEPNLGPKRSGQR